MSGRVQLENVVLEETLIIRGPIDLPEVAHGFREAGMPTRITQTVALEGLVSAKGMIRNFKTLLKEEVARIEKLAEEFRTREGIEEDEDTGSRELYDPYLKIIERLSQNSSAGRGPAPSRSLPQCDTRA